MILSRSSFYNSMMDSHLLVCNAMYRYLIVMAMLQNHLSQGKKRFIIAGVQATLFVPACLFNWKLTTIMYKIIDEL